MKKVLISAYTCCPATGSEPGNGWNWLMGYIENGYEVHCVTSSKYKAKIKSHLDENRKANLIFYFTDHRMALRFLKIPVIGIYFHYFLWIWMARKRVKTLAESFVFSHAHHVTYSSIKFGTPIYNLKLKSILGPLGGGELPHKSLRKYFGYHFYFIYLKSKLSDFLAAINPAVRLSIVSADLILTGNDVAKKTIRRYSDKETVKMFDTGISDYFESHFTERDLSSRINVLWIARMLPRKGLNLAIEAVTCLPENFNFHFTIIGDGISKKQAQLMVKEADLESKVTFIDRVPHESLSDIYRNSHILLFPSLIDSCPMQVFEALALGMPVVTLDHQGMSEQVNDTRGKKISVGENINYPEELANAILSICKTKEVFNNYSVNAYNYGQKQIMKNRIKYFLADLYE
jgi:glycosyltransferase involved in cell wall biosynthesis